MLKQIEFNIATNYRSFWRPLQMHV